MIKLDKERFQKLISEYDYNKSRNSIGILKEKSIHSILKNYIDSNTNHHEVKVDGFVCDIYDGNEIYEIQTRSLDKLRNKLDKLSLNHIVNIVFPLSKTKEVCWVDQETGEVVSARLSPKKCSQYDSMKELYKIKMCLNDNIRFHIIFLDTTEYRNLDGYGKTKKRYSTRHELVARNIDSIYSLNCLSDYKKLLNGLEEFSNQSLSKHLGTTLRNTTLLTNILTYIGVIEVVRKENRRNIYKVK